MRVEGIGEIRNIVRLDGRSHVPVTSRLREHLTRPDSAPCTRGSTDTIHTDSRRFNDELIHHGARPPPPDDAGVWQAVLLLAGSCMPVLGAVLITPILPQLSERLRRRSRAPRCWCR